jgi:hypothetical protein
MARDFDEARGEASAAGARALWFFRLALAVDLARTCGVQWVRTGRPAIALASLLVPLAMAEAIAAVARRARIPAAVNRADDEVLTVLLIAIVCAMLVATTIVVNLWVTRLNSRRSAGRLIPGPFDKLRPGG